MCIQKRADARANLPPRARWIAKADAVSEVLGGNQAGAASALPDRRAELFQTTIDAAMLQAYRETEYRVAGDTPFILRIGQHSPELSALHARYRCSASAYVTACNPFSRTLSDTENRVRHDELGVELTARGLKHFEGLGQHPTNGWPGERSYLILELDLEAARALGSRYEQNAIVWLGPDAVPQLIPLR